MGKKTRCWKGYRPVKGKAPYSPGSCEKVSEAYRSMVRLAEEAWTRKEGQSETGGLNAKGRASLRAKGQNIQAPVTEKNPKGKAKKRRASFCRRMGGMKKKLTSAKTANDPDSRINKALRKWNC